MEQQEKEKFLTEKKSQPEQPMDEKFKMETYTDQTETNVFQNRPESTYRTLEKKVNRLQVCLVVASFLCGLAIVACIILIAVLFQNLNDKIDNHVDRPTVGQQMAYILQHESLCLSCDDIRLGPSPEEDEMLNKFKRKYEKGQEQCCVRTPKQLLSLLEMVIERRYREELARGNIQMKFDDKTDWKGAPPAAHLLGSLTRQEQPLGPGTQVPVSHWIHEEDIAFTNHIKYQHGRLVVPSDGLYFVYCQINFHELYDGYSHLHTDMDSLSHYLYRYNVLYREGGGELLAQNSITKSNSRKSFGEYTSYLGGLFNLRQGDEVFVKVSNVTLINRHLKLNYFGMFRVVDGVL